MNLCKDSTSFKCVSSECTVNYMSLISSMLKKFKVPEQSHKYSCSFRCILLKPQFESMTNTQCGIMAGISSLNLQATQGNLKVQ